jgi:hypothetical protein
MPRTRRYYRLGWLVAGLVVGSALGIALSTGKRQRDDVATRLVFEELKLKAYAAHGNETFVIANGPVDDNIEGVFCLDFLTGDLTGLVLHPRTGKFQSAFKTNVVKDLPVERGKKPAYALTVGRFKAYAPLSNTSLGDGVVYVADCNTGRVATYAFPWNKSGGDIQLVADPLTRLDVVSTRELKNRE